MIDLRRCQPGDKLIRRDGEIGEYRALSNSVVIPAERNLSKSAL